MVYYTFIMVKDTELTISTSSAPPESKIKVMTDENSTILRIPAKGFKGKGLITMIVITVWMFTILVWTVLLLNMKPLYMLYSLPFWAIGFWTLIKSIKMLRLEQSIILNENSVTLRMKRGDIIEERQFLKKDIVVSLVEGSFYSYTGLNKRGQYPAIIYNNEAFGFAERSSVSEKEWLLNFVKANLTGKQKRYDK